MTESYELLLERPQAHEVVLFGGVDATLLFLKIGKYGRPIIDFECTEGSVEFFLGIFADFCPEQHYKNIGATYFLVILVLKSSW
jgi:hypothetical protein